MSAYRQVLPWRTYTISPGDEGWMGSECFTAPDQENAFAQARARWPWVKQWTLHRTSGPLMTDEAAERSAMENRTR